jgi:hypothetical protein
VGSSLSKIYDDYDDYVALCEEFGVEPKGIRDNTRSFYDHEDDILREHGFKDKQTYYQYKRDNVRWN